MDLSVSPIYHCQYASWWTLLSICINRLIHR